MLSLSRKLMLVLAAAASVSGCAQTSQPDTRSMQGGGMGMGMMGGGMMAPERSPGWMMMSEQERADHRSRMMSFKSPDDCRKYMWDHHKAMLERAKAQGKTLSDLPQDACPGGMGMGMGMMGGGMGMGMMGGGRMTPEQSPGWAMMSEQERAEHRKRMMSFQSTDECRKYVEDHHKMMLDRAKAQGKTLPDLPKDACPAGMGMMMQGGDKR